jgi:hypothetical protein
MGTSAIVSEASKGQRGRICRRWQADSWWYAPCLVELTLAGRLVAWSVCYGRMLQLDSNLDWTWIVGNRLVLLRCRITTGVRLVKGKVEACLDM